MVDYKKILTGLLSKAYKMEEGRISEILEQTDEASIQADLLTEDRERISKVKPKEDGTSKFQEGYAKAKKEERSLFEKELKEAYGIDSDLTGKELVEHIVTTKAGEAVTKAGKKDLTEDEIKSTPTFRKLEKDLKKQIEDKEKEFAEKIEATKAGFEKEQTFGSFSQEAIRELKALNPILPKDATKAQNQLNTFARQLLADGIEVRKEDGGFLLLKDGKRLEDGHGNAISWKDYVKTKGSDLFEFEANNGGNNSGNANDGKNGGNNGQGGSGGAAGGKKWPDGHEKPKDFAGYSKLIQNRDIPLADRQAMQEVWTADNGRTE